MIKSLVITIASGSAFLVSLTVEEVQRASKMYQMKIYDLTLARISAFNKSHVMVVRKPIQNNMIVPFSDNWFWAWNAKTGGWFESTEKNFVVMSSVTGTLGCARYNVDDEFVYLCNVKFPEKLLTEGSFQNKTFTHELRFTGNIGALPLGIDKKIFEQINH